MTASLTTWSRRMSYILRHNPASAGLTLDPAGWARIADLVAGVPGLTREVVLAVTAADTKSRFTISGELIRAAQGHTVQVDPVGHVQVPPATLFHGTTATAADSIMTTGLNAGSRRDVHLSANVETATTVGARRGDPVILSVDAAAAHAAGLDFRIADNGVWLTSQVPAQFITR